MRRWLWLLLCSACLAQNPAVGIVTTVKGDARILDPGSNKTRAAQLADVLLPGTRLVTGRDAQVVFVFCPHAASIVAPARTTVEFGKADFSVKSGNLGPQQRVPSCRIPVPFSAGGPAHVGGVNMRGQSNLVLTSPVGITLLPEMVKFAWKPAAGATLYRIALRDQEGEEFWEQESRESEQSYGGSRPLSPGGTYRWRVTALRGDEVLSSASASFRILGPEESTRIEAVKAAHPAGEERHIMLGMLYEELNMPEQALAEYEQLRIVPGSWLEAQTVALRSRLRP